MVPPEFRVLMKLDVPPPATGKKIGTFTDHPTMLPLPFVENLKNGLLALVFVMTLTPSMKLKETGVTKVSTRFGASAAANSTNPDTLSVGLWKSGGVVGPDPLKLLKTFPV